MSKLIIEMIEEPLQFITEGEGDNKNMNLVSKINILDNEPTTVRFILFQENIDNVSLNIDLKVFISKDGGLTEKQLILSNDGTYESNKRIISRTQRCWRGWI